MPPYRRPRPRIRSRDGNASPAAVPLRPLAVRFAAAVAFGIAAALLAAAPARAGAAVPSDLLAAAKAQPEQSFSVIVQGDGTTSSAEVAHAVVDAITREAYAALTAAQVELDAARAEVASAQNRLDRLHRQIAKAEQRAARASAQAQTLAGTSKVSRYEKLVAQAAEQKARAAALRDQIPAAEQAIADAQAALPPLAAEVAALTEAYEAARTEAAREQLGDQFMSISGVAARLLGADLVDLANREGVLSITRDLPVALVPTSNVATPLDGVPNGTMWRDTTNVDVLWSTIDPVTGEITFAPQAPAIAIVDSGIDASRVADFGGRVIASVNLSSLAPGASGDGQGHGTMVAGIAAGSSPHYPGAAPNAALVDVRTADDNGRSLTSDVLRGVDWILANRKRYDIRVANFSLAGTSEASIKYDPLDRAVEKLWFSGIVVVAAVGNHGTAAAPAPIPAPGNDPFVITVGAVDQRETADPADDTRAPWSAYGYTADGFAKPELSAPGRYIVGPVPENATMPASRPERVVAPGYMWMSGTSFSAPIVAGAAAQILARHRDWSPDQVKGALMLTAAPLQTEGFTAGVGEVDAAAASAVADPPNPNAALAPFVKTTGGVSVFDVGAWERAAGATASWSSASWSSASWSSAGWSSASWSTASWSSTSWSSASWSSATWSSASWSSAVDVE